MRGVLTLMIVLVLSTGTTAGLGAPHEQTAVPSALLGRWSRTVTHAAWLKYGRDFPTTTVRIAVDKTGKQIGYFGPDFPPVPPSAIENAQYPDWYTDWNVAGATITVGAVPPCGWLGSSTGRYRWSVAGRTLTITKRADRCPDRIAIFAGKWKKSS
jgi:hypothetical protein